ncbi:MAG: hypothetical protein IAE80_17465 [Anaerolinea sp.]|nr:hypothetical protein [Anaerolinea sp.]
MSRDPYNAEPPMDDDLPEYPPEYPPERLTPFDEPGDEPTPSRPMRPVTAWSSEQTPARPMPPVPTDDLDPDATPQPSRRHSKARERIEKRKRQTGTTHAVPLGSADAVPRSRPPRQRRQISVPTNLPKINLKIGRGAFYVIGSILLVVIVIFALGRLRNQPPEVNPNAIWIGTEWTYEERTDDEIKALAQQLRDNKIGTVYAWVSWLQDDNTWRQADTGAWDRVKSFRERLELADPGVELIGWISLPVNGGDGYRMDEVEVLDAVAAFSGRVVTEFGFDGVFLNVEPVWNDDQNFLELLRKTRSVVGLDVPIAAAIPPDWSPLGAGIPVPALITPGTIWEKAYKQSVALLVDQMAVMAYNSALTAPADYSRWMAYQVETYARAMAELDIGTQVLIGIPTYDAELPGHDPLVETVPAAIDGIKLGIEQAGETASFVRGVVIYGYWTTDETEWSQFRREWVE